MKKIMRKLIVIIMAAVIAAPVIAAPADAASTVSISSPDSVKGGEVFTVTVTYNGDSVGRVVGDVTYDTEMLSYISGGSSSGNVGYVELRKAGTGETLSFDLKFQALKEGSATLNVSTSELYDLGEMFMDTPSDSSRTIEVSGNAADDEIIEETNPEDDAADEGLSVDEKSDTPEEEPVDDSDQDNAGENSSSLARMIMFAIGGLVLLLIIILIFRRRR